jgi:hypothetical protein
MICGRAGRQSLATSSAATWLPPVHMARGRFGGIHELAAPCLSRSLGGCDTEDWRRPSKVNNELLEIYRG